MSSYLSIYDNILKLRCVGKQIKQTQRCLFCLLVTVISVFWMTVTVIVTSIDHTACHLSSSFFSKRNKERTRVSSHFGRIQFEDVCRTDQTYVNSMQISRYVCVCTKSWRACVSFSGRVYQCASMVWLTRPWQLTISFFLNGGHYLSLFPTTLFVSSAVSHVRCVPFQSN